MLDELFFEKCFSVGLALNTDINRFNRFLDRYHMFIDNIYFSLPLGDRFHGRDLVSKQFRESENVTLFWQLIKSVVEHSIHTDVVFNTHGLLRSDFEEAKALLQENNLHIDKISLLNDYYKDIRELFPNATLVRSVNDMPDEENDILSECHKFDEVVIGRQHIRNSKLFSQIQEKGTRCVLLLNNGCSHTCGGCRSFEYCEKTFERDSKKYSSEYVYALQSILPYEIHENFFDINSISFFKLSTRNADVEYIEKCILSYIHNNALKFVNENYSNYLLWSRLYWHIKFFCDYDFKKIKMHKINICKLAIDQI